MVWLWDSSRPRDSPTSVPRSSSISSSWVRPTGAKLGRLVGWGSNLAALTPFLLSPPALQMPPEPWLTSPTLTCKGSPCQRVWGLRISRLSSCSTGSIVRYKLPVVPAPDRPVSPALCAGAAVVPPRNGEVQGLPSPVSTVQQGQYGNNNS